MKHFWHSNHPVNSHMWASRRTQITNEITYTMRDVSYMHLRKHWSNNHDTDLFNLHGIKYSCNKKYGCVRASPNMWPNIFANHSIPIWQFEHVISQLCTLNISEVIRLQRNDIYQKYMKYSDIIGKHRIQCEELWLYESLFPVTCTTMGIDNFDTLRLWIVAKWHQPLTITSVLNL